MNTGGEAAEHLLGERLQHLIVLGELLAQLGFGTTGGLEILDHARLIKPFIQQGSAHFEMELHAQCGTQTERLHLGGGGARQQLGALR